MGGQEIRTQISADKLR